jgi:CheY-like chemotaxis protein
MAGKLKVLLVEDNPMVKTLLSQAIAPLASVTAASDGADALARVAADPPDLVISDFHMPGMDGRQLLEELHGRGNGGRIPFILLASKSDISERLKPVQDMLEDFIEKPFFTRDAVARVRRVLDKIALEKMAREAPGETVLRGTLAQMNVIDLMQSLELGRKTCCLSLIRGDERCDIYFNEGQIRHAAYGEMTGDEAVFRALTWAEGNFSIDFSGTTSEQTTSRSTQGLLMEGLRLLDESNRETEE